MPRLHTRLVVCCKEHPTPYAPYVGWAHARRGAERAPVVRSTGRPAYAVAESSYLKISLLNTVKQDKVWYYTRITFLNTVKKR